MKKNSNKEFLNRDEVNEMIESALRRHMAQYLNQSTKLFLMTLLERILY